MPDHHGDVGDGHGGVGYGARNVWGVVMATTTQRIQILGSAARFITILY